ncbi:ABC transporter ATP-binding protein [Cesiribacter andamanensis]|uniref:Teichoic acids export ATP-binding protein TagH n=1 Tax=Cesiribacter andamanensis AMV16 TaxID=1279009 RepID=M7N907_9BACT|nr:ABC transporter ATP-binding protein [Cesiribacter andamanensis]EMR03691.1 Teichoic acids export ATP-binding protein TagH [Cesiribacter andamanensis AMV16]
MSDIAIRVENLGKRYQIGQAKSGDLRSSFSGWINRLTGNRNGPLEAQTEKEFWALRDINFEIRRGEAVGIIGRNGAGKSTLLKILSRITEPTTGRYEINGRVSSLLEVGTGFHPELSGRENIYLNGTILGMKRREVKAKFDEIVAFSGVEKFIDTPVKHYSSGMKVRLAFSVAAHLEPEILIIDEVLAVGDAEFQRKCLGKMDEVSREEGRTIVFVSHNMNAVQNICSKGVFLHNGLIEYKGTALETITNYLKKDSNISYNNKFNYQLNEYCSLNKFTFSDENVELFGNILFNIVLESKVINPISSVALLFYNQYQERIAIIDLRDSRLHKITTDGSLVNISGEIESVPFVEGEYSIGLYIASNLCVGNFTDLLKIHIVGAKSSMAPYPVNVRGIVELKSKFEVDDKA